ncbi:hypothetical protein PIROE2DRAFT_12533 [Piromyces sp. E2]|nr:hypothetical protein PIROE2DRAFT_12533 [Piromyces sp. E2]|eukprot:OUM61482.1 hypothetical protein PIROE2DRAFT_12533 [Piromyces sp. E2]
MTSKKEKENTQDKVSQLYGKIAFLEKIVNKNTTRDNYYNNNENESIKKMGLNCFENLFFSKFIANKMIPEEKLKIIVNLMYTKVYDVFISSPPKEENVFIGKILDITMNYECLKNFCKISLSSRIFNTYNPILTKEWDDIYKKIL